MDHYLGIDVSLELSSLCVMDQTGKILLETKVASEPEALIAFIRTLSTPITLVGLEAGPLSQWLHAGLTAEGIDVVLMETRHVKGALKAMPVKTDRRDAQGIAQLLRTGWYRPVHCKSASAQEVRALLTARKLLLTKVIDLELGLRGVLRGFGLKMGKVSRGHFAERARAMVDGNPMLEHVTQAMLVAREALQAEMANLDRRARDHARNDATCRLLMTVPGVGALTALTFKSAVDDPTRFRSSKMLGPHFGLTPSKHQSGETDITGSITRAGDAMVRSILYEAATALLTRAQSYSSLKSWGMAVMKRRGLKRATVAVARKLATVLHRMWIDGVPFRFGKESAPAGA
jgi:transposase